MMNEPTKRATRANARRKVLKIAMIFWNASWLSLVNTAPVMASASGGRAAATRSWSTAWDTPSVPATEIQSNSPGSPTMACAVVVSKSAACAPPQVSSFPNRAMPTTVKF